MPYAVFLIIVFCESFLLGSIPCGVIVGKCLYGKDPRQGGSGSIGMTNMARLFGAKAAAITFAGDVIKGALAVGITRILLEFAPIAISAKWQIDLALSLSITAGIAGHVFSPWLHFKGGKGISTGLGTILVGYPPVLATILASFLIVAGITRRISAGSIVAALMIPVATLIFEWGNIPLFVLGCIIAIFVTWAHRGNIKRIIAGTEPKFSFHKNEDESKEKPENKMPSENADANSTDDEKIAGTNRVSEQNGEHHAKSKDEGEEQRCAIK